MMDPVRFGDSRFRPKQCSPVPVADRFWLQTGSGCSPVPVVIRLWLWTNSGCCPVSVVDGSGCRRNLIFGTQTFLL